ncbi:unnamed protein product, partial [Pedinophyceae sp. YPF-701]
VRYLWSRNEVHLGSADFPMKGYPADLVTGEGLERVFEKLGWAVSVVVNCAAVSQPGACERDPAGCRAVNVPSRLVACMQRQLDKTGEAPLLIHLSTDQVYDGARGGYGEGDACEPVNEYGRSKLLAEEYIRAHWSNHVILRSSIIYGPPPTVPVGRGLFLQFIEDALRSGKETQFFADEWRCPIFIDDICSTIARVLARAMIVNHAPERPKECQIPLDMPQTINMGGPDKLSRVDMARLVAEAAGLDPAPIKECSAAAVDRPYKSPADISMDTTLLTEVLKVKTTSFIDALHKMYQHQSKASSMTRGEDSVEVDLTAA